MQKMLVAVLLSLFLVPVFADMGPGPEPPVIKITLMQGTTPYTGDANATYLCSNATVRGASKNAVAPGDFQLNCTGGVCANDGWYYKFNPCFYSKGSFEVDTANKQVTTPQISIESGGFYSFNVDVNSGQTTPVSHTDIPCIGTFLSLVLLTLFAFKRK